MPWIKTAWADEGDGPWLVAAFDEWTFDNWGGEPDFYQEAINEHAGIRELVLDLPEGAIAHLWEPQRVAATVRTPDA